MLDNIYDEGSFTRVYFMNNKIYGNTNDIFKIILKQYPHYKFPRLVDSDIEGYDYMTEYYPFIFGDPTTGNWDGDIENFKSHLKEEDSLLFDELLEAREYFVVHGDVSQAFYRYISDLQTVESLISMYEIIANKFKLPVKLDTLFRNVACTAQGDLIFLDIFFMPDFHD